MIEPVFEMNYENDEDVPMINNNPDAEINEGIINLNNIQTSTIFTNQTAPKPKRKSRSKKSWGWAKVLQIDENTHKCGEEGCNHQFIGLNQRTITISKVISHFRSKHIEIYQQEAHPTQGALDGDKNLALLDWISRRNLPLRKFHTWFG